MFVSRQWSRHLLHPQTNLVITSYFIEVVHVGITVLQHSSNQWQNLSWSPLIPRGHCITQTEELHPWDVEKLCREEALGLNWARKEPFDGRRRHWKTARPLNNIFKTFFKHLSSHRTTTTSELCWQHFFKFLDFLHLWSFLDCVFIQPYSSEPKDGCE